MIQYSIFIFTVVEAPHEVGCLKPLSGLNVAIPGNIMALGLFKGGNIMLCTIIKKNKIPSHGRELHNK